jgi:hypothetical protein
MIRLRGIFVQRKGAFYNGAYYDSLRDEASDAQITLIVPALIDAITVTFGQIANRGKVQPSHLVCL